MTPARRALLVLVLLIGGAVVRAEQQTAQSDDLAPTIANLGSFDFPARTDAARTLRRLPPAVAIPALAAAVKAHADEYVRFRALVILTGFGGPVADATVREVLADRNDRIRTVAYQWIEHHPDPARLPSLVDALPKELSEFVRPALTRAIVAFGADPRAQQVVQPLVLRGENLFRGTVIEALGDFKGSYALADLITVANQDGPLQDDAVTALGKIGDPAARPVLAALQGTAPRDRQPTVSGALCLIGVDCPGQMAFVKDALVFAGDDEEYQLLLRSAAHALGVMAIHGHPEALTTLIDAGVPARDPARSPIALAAGLAALRKPEVLLDELSRRGEPGPAIELVRDAFDMLAEDYEEEQFFAEMRRAYWAAAEASPRRNTAGRIIEILEF